jgi:hypothetical protein
MLRKVCFQRSRASLSFIGAMQHEGVRMSRVSVVIRRGCRGKGHPVERSLACESRRNEAITYNFGRATELPDRFEWIRQIREIRKTRGIPTTTRIFAIFPTGSYRAARKTSSLPIPAVFRSNVEHPVPILFCSCSFLVSLSLSLPSNSPPI